MNQKTVATIAILLAVAGVATVLPMPGEADAAAPIPVTGPDSVRLMEHMSVLAHDEAPPVPLTGAVINVNLDMVSRSGGVLWASGTYHTPELRPVLAGYPFVYFGVEDHPDYHRPTDDVERVNPQEFVNAVRTVLMAIRALDEALPLPFTSAPR